MSSIARWTYTNVATVWPVTRDRAGNLLYGQPHLLSCTWKLGGDVQRDAMGNEFVPKSTFYYEADWDAADKPQRNWYIAPRDRRSATGPFEAGAELIAEIVGYDMSMFGAAETPDWVLFTK